MQNTGKIIFISGILIALIGLAIWLLGNKLSWFGNLPGDIRIRKENFSVFIPVTTMIILSIVLSLLLWLIRKLF